MNSGYVRGSYVLHFSYFPGVIAELQES